MSKVRFADMDASARAEARQGYRDEVRRLSVWSVLLGCESRESSWEMSRAVRREWDDVDIGMSVAYASGRELATARYAARLS